MSYSIARSRSGTDVEFADMVQRCKAVGVGIIVDAVINHMTNFPSPGVGSNGTAYTKYDYPGLYSPSDFHPPCTVSNYQSAANVQDCELLSLPDLNTGLPSVRQKIADYLIRLARLGVAGFRIDAAKHIQQVELDDILSPRGRYARAPMACPVPYYYLEVVGGAGEALSPRDYFGEGVQLRAAPRTSPSSPSWAWATSSRRRAASTSPSSNPNGPPGSQFSPAGVGAHALRQGGGLPAEPRHPALLRPELPRRRRVPPGQRVDAGPALWLPVDPVELRVQLPGRKLHGAAVRRGRQHQRRHLCLQPGDGDDRPVGLRASRPVLSGTWSGFRRVVAGTDVNHWWDNGANAIAFSRGGKGFVAINREGTPLSVTVPTGLPPGDYCDRITGGLVNGSCVGTTITVDGAGNIQLQLPAMSAIAIDIVNQL